MMVGGRWRIPNMSVSNFLEYTDQNLQESLDSPYPYRTTLWSEVQCIVLFTSSDGDSYRIEIQKRYGQASFDFRNLNDSKSVYDLGRNKKDVMRIYSTLVYILVRYVKEFSPEICSFAFEKKLLPIYMRFLNRHLPKNYKITTINMNVNDHAALLLTRTDVPPPRFHIQESFDSPYPYTILKWSEENVRCKFKTDSGGDYEIDIDVGRIEAIQSYIFDPYHEEYDGPIPMEFKFGSVSKGKSHYLPHQGKHPQIRVYSTAIRVLEKYIRDFRYPLIMLTPASDRQERIYVQMVKKLINKVGYKFIHIKNETLLLYNPKEVEGRISMAEAFDTKHSGINNANLTGPANRFSIPNTYGSHANLTVYREGNKIDIVITDDGGDVNPIKGRGSAFKTYSEIAHVIESYINRILGVYSEAIIEYEAGDDKLQRLYKNMLNHIAKREHYNITHMTEFNQHRGHVNKVVVYK